MADETTKELSGDNLLRVLLERVDQLFALNQQMDTRLDSIDTRLVKVEAYVSERIYDTRPRLDIIIKEIADVKEGLRETNNEMRLLREEVWGERKARGNLEYRVELLERKAA
jgi:uncharacterized coiled-coil DUF342 family protein